MANNITVTATAPARHSTRKTVIGLARDARKAGVRQTSRETRTGAAAKVRTVAGSIRNAVRFALQPRREDGGAPDVRRRPDTCQEVLLRAQGVNDIGSQRAAHRYERGRRRSRA